MTAGKGASSDVRGTLRVDVTGDVRISDGERQRLVRHVLLALSRFGPQVRRATVRLSEPVNPLGGVDQFCLIRAWMLHSDDLQAEAINGGFEEAVVRAAAQLAQRVGYALDGDGHDGPATRPAVKRPPALKPRRRSG
jgi:hypothetical protein